MTDTTTIEWVIAVARSHGMIARVWNPVRGCRPASDGCLNCWAARVADTRSKHPNGAIRARHEGLTTRNADGKPVFNGTVRLIEDDLTIPLRTKRPSVWFAPSEGDLFAEGVTDEMRDRVFAVMAMCPQHIFQVLTKRSGRMREYFANLEAVAAKWAEEVGEFNATDLLNLRHMARRPHTASPIPHHIWPLPNVWLGVSVENQAAADERIPHLLASPAAVRFLSCEPLLGPVDLNSSLGGTRWVGGQRGCDGTHRGIGTPECPREPHHHHDDRCRPGLDWVIAGGESGPKARPMHPDWHRDTRDWCAGARFVNRTPRTVNQSGPGDNLEAGTCKAIGARAAPESSSTTHHPTEPLLGEPWPNVAPTPRPNSPTAGSAAISTSTISSAPRSCGRSGWGSSFASPSKQWRNLNAANRRLPGKMVRHRPQRRTAIPTVPRGPRRHARKLPRRPAGVR